MHMFRTSNGLASEQQSVWCLHIGTYQQASNNQQTEACCPLSTDAEGNGSDEHQTLLAILHSTRRCG
jgi:hypothetical protein